MKKELRSKSYGASGTVIGIVGFLLSALAGATCAYIFEFFSFEGCPDQTNIILGIVVFVVCEFAVIVKRKIVAGIHDVLELGEELEKKLELISGVEVISDGLEEDEKVEPEVVKKQDSSRSLFKKKHEKASDIPEQPQHSSSDPVIQRAPEPVVSPLRSAADPVIQRAPEPVVSPVRSVAEPVVQKAPEPVASPLRSVAEPVVQRAPEPVASPLRSVAEPVVQKAPEPVVSPLRSAAEPVVQRAPEPVVSPLRSAAEPVVQKAPEPVVSPLRSAAEPVVQRAPEPVAAPHRTVEEPVAPTPVKEPNPVPENDGFELMFEEATDDML